MTEIPAAKRSRLAYGGFFAALALTFITLSMGPLHRFGVIEFAIARQVLTVAAFAGPATALACLAAVFLARPGRGRRGRLTALAGLILSLSLTGFLWSMVHTAMTLPRIHDITTDTDDPPAFAAVLALRRATDNDAAYAGAAIADQQKAAYPNIAPLKTGLSPDAAFARALKTAEAFGWRIVAADRSLGRIEASATTPWFGFSDDIVIRLRASDSGTVIDLRSASRIGLSDLGANAMRIERFITTFKDMS